MDPIRLFSIYKTYYNFDEKFIMSQINSLSAIFGIRNESDSSIPFLIYNNIFFYYHIFALAIPSGEKLVTGI